MFTSKPCPYNGGEVHKFVSNVIVVTSGNISNSAEIQILTKQTTSNKENTSYIGQEMLISLLDKYYPEIWISELPVLSRYLNTFKGYIEKLTETENVDEQVHDLIATHCQKKIENPDSLNKNEKDSPLDVLGKGGKRIWFQGGTGSGKTFIAHNYARTVISSIKKENKTSSSRYAVPVYLKAMWFENISVENQSLKEIIKKSFDYVGAEVAEIDIEAWLSTCGICIFYDELEMNSNPQLLNFLHDELTKLTASSSLILLSRFMDEHSIKISFKPEVWHIKEINLSQASRALSISMPLSNPKAKHIYRDVIQGNMLERLPRTPLAINILRKVFVDMELGKLPNNAFEFFEIFFEITLGKWEQKRDPSRPLDYKQVKAFLQTVAFRMVKSAKISIKVDEILDIAKNLLDTTGQKHIQPREYVHQIASFGEVCRIADDNFEFVQRTYQEFLAGCELKDHHWSHQEIKENYIKINWEESVIFAAGGKQKDDVLLGVLSDREVTNFSERFSKLKNLHMHLTGPECQI